MSTKKLIIIACFVLIISMLSASTPDLITPYLKSNHASLDIDNLSLELMKDELENYDVYLSGSEWHGTTASYDLQYALTTALHREAGVKYLLMGIGHASAQMYNAYLNSGDEEILETILSAIKFSNSSNHEHRLAWEKLYQYNQAQPKDQRITVVGIDMEYEIYLAIQYITSLTGYENLPILPLPRATPDSIDVFVTRMQEDVAANEEHYRSVMGDDFSELQLVLSNLEDTVAAHTAANFYDAKERILYENFLRAWSSLPPGKYFGLWSMEHIYQRDAGTENLGGFDRLAMYLKHEEDSPVRDRVLSMAAVYLDSQYRFYYGSYHNRDISTELFTDLYPFRTLASNDYTLFRLNGQDSPFAMRPYTVKNPTGGVAIDYYQYLLVIRNSVPGSPNR